MVYRDCSLAPYLQVINDDGTGYPANSSSIASWKTPEAEVMPNSMRRKQNLPNAVLEVVR